MNPCVDLTIGIFVYFIVSLFPVGGSLAGLGFSGRGRGACETLPEEQTNAALLSHDDTKSKFFTVLSVKIELCLNAGHQGRMVGSDD